MIPMLDSTSRRLWSSGKPGWSTGEIVGIAREAIAIVLREQMHPLSDDLHWGWREGAPEGLVLMSHMHIFAVGTGDKNAALSCPTRPEAGNLGEGICLHCMATHDI